MNIWLVMIIAGMVTFGIRLSFIVFVDHNTMPSLIGRSLRYIPPAVLTAIIIPEVLMQNGAIEISLENTRLLAGVLAALVAWRTRSAVLTILVGMGVLWLFGWMAAR